MAYQILGKENSDNALIDIIENAKDVPLRKTAINKFTDQCFLAKIAKNDKDVTIRLFTIEKLTDQKILAEIVKNVNLPSVVRIEAIKKLADQKLLVNITNDHDYNIRKNAYIKLGTENTPKFLADIAKHDSDYYIRKQAIEKLTNEVELEDIAANDKDFEIRQLAYKMLKKENTEDALTDIALFSKSNDERIKALTKISCQNLIKIIEKCNDNFIQVSAVLYLANPVPFLHILIRFLNTRESWDSPNTRDRVIQKLKLYSEKLSTEGKIFLLNQTKATNPKKHYDYQQSCFDGKYSNHVDSYGY